MARASANRPHRSRPQPAGMIDVEMVGDSRQIDKMLMGFERAMDHKFLAADFLAVRVHGNLEKRARERFASEGDSTVGKWAPLKPYTLQVRAEKGQGSRINDRTGAMKRHILDSGPQALPNGIGATLWFPTRTVGAELKRKITVAQQGKPRDGVSGATVPRPVLGVDMVDLTETLVSFAFYLKSHVMATGVIR